MSAAVIGMRAIYEPGYDFAKAGVMLLGVHAASEEQFELDLEDDEPERDRARLMTALDAVNDRWGKGTMRIGSAKPRRAAHGGWETKQERRTPAYTTDWDSMPIARS